MTLEIFFENFGHLADGPEGVAKLRTLVLELAVRGRLAPQVATDEPAKELLRRIAASRESLADSGEIRRGKPLPAISRIPFALPAGWEWARLDDLPSWGLTDGDWVESKDQDPSGDVRLIQLADVGEGKYRDRSSRFLTSSTADRLRCTYLQPSDVLIARLPRPLGRACIFPGDPKPSITAVDVAIARCGKDLLDPEYLVIAINSETTRRSILEAATGTTRQRVSTGNLKKLILSVPPEAEQHRIVAKVDRLMALCDELEIKLQQARVEAEKLLDSVVHDLLAT